MSGESDIAAIITADASGFSGAIDEATGEAKSFFQMLTETGTTAIQTVWEGYKLYVGAIWGITKTAGSAVAGVAMQIGTDIYDDARDVLKGVASEFVRIAVFGTEAGAAATATSSYFLGFWNTMKLGLNVAGWFIPWVKAVAIGLTAATVAVYAFQAADEYLNGELSESILNFEQTTEAYGKFQAQLQESGQELGLVGDGLGSLGAQAAQFIMDYGGLGLVMQSVDDIAGASLDALTPIMKFHTDGLKAIREVTSDWMSTVGASAQQLSNLATSTEEVTAKITAQSDAFAQLRAMQESATAQAEHNAEVQRIGALDNIAAIDAEKTALQAKQAQMIRDGQVTEQSQKNAAALFAAIENQKNAVNSGKMEKKDKPEKASDAESSIAQAGNALRQLAIGNDEAAISALIMKGATEQEIETLRELQAEIAELSAEKQAEKERDAERKSQEKAEESQRKRTTDQIAAEADAIDVLTGAITEQEAAKRGLMRGGMSQGDAEELAALQAEKDRLEEAGKKKPEGNKSDTTIKAAFQGSQEAAQIALRGVGGGKTMEQIAQKQLAVQQSIVTAIKDNKPYELIPVEF